MVTGDRNSEQSQFCRGSTTLFNGSRLDHFCDMNHPDLTPILTISHHLLNGWSVGGRGGHSSRYQWVWRVPGRRVHHSGHSRVWICHASRLYCYSTYWQIPRGKSMRSRSHPLVVRLICDWDIVSKSHLTGWRCNNSATTWEKSWRRQQGDIFIIVWAAIVFRVCCYICVIFCWRKSWKPFMSPEGAVTKETLGCVISYLYLYNMEKKIFLATISHILNITLTKG